jgi:hypothetical protein
MYGMHKRLNEHNEPVLEWIQPWNNEHRYDKANRRKKDVFSAK